MRILVTGASGFTGRHFTRLARTSGYEVHELTSNLLDKRRLFEEVAKREPDFVLHLAAISFVQHARLSDFFDVNVKGTQYLLEALVRLKHRPQRILLTSSSSVYGNAANSPIAETSPLNPVNAYGESKVQMEELAKGYLSELQICVLRPFNYTGIGQSQNFLVPKIVSHFVRSENVIKLGKLNIKREFNDVRFVASAYLSLFEGTVAFREYNLCTGVAYAISDIIELLIGLFGHAPKVEVDENLKRNNEVPVLLGDPSRLFVVTGSFSGFNLRDTLAWMSGIRT